MGKKWNLGKKLKWNRFHGAILQTISNLVWDMWLYKNIILD